MLVFTFPLCLCACRTFLDQEKSGQGLRSRKKRAPRQQYSWGKETYTVCHHGWWSAIAEWIQTGVCMEAPATNNIWWTKAEDWLWCTGLCVYYTGMISQLKLYTCIKLLLLLLLLLKTKILILLLFDLDENQWHLHYCCKFTCLLCLLHHLCKPLWKDHLTFTDQACLI